MLHYLNQFFAGIGGEERADVGVSLQQGAVGPGNALAGLLGGEAQVTATLVCGDNFLNEHTDEALERIEAHLREERPDLLVAGPAFNAGRYSIACVEVCRLAEALGIPAVTGMHPEAPGVLSRRGEVLIWPTAGTAAGMKAALEGMTRLARKRLRGEPLGPAEQEGYLPRGDRRPHDRGRPGSARALDMLLDKLHGRPYASEVPVHVPERVAPAAPIADPGRARIALVTTGGLVKKGNPDRAVSFNATRFHRHPVAELQSLSSEAWEAYHAGYFNHLVNRNPNYILPLNFLRELAARGMVGGVFDWIYALPGVSTPVHASKRMGAEIAADLRRGGVDGVLLVAT